jgi:ADP-heptose:LPS heptosyltransferase
MKSGSKIKIDRIIAGPFAFLLNFATRCLGLIMRRDHQFPETPRVIGVAKFAGLGSIIGAIPMLQALKQKYPKALLIFITSKNNAALLERINLIDKRIYVSEKSFITIFASTLALIFRLWLLRPTLYFDLELYSYYASIVATLSLARNRIGFYRKSTRVKEGLFTHLVFFNTYMPVHQLYLQLARTAGCTGPLQVAPGENLEVRDRDRDEAAEFIKKFSWGRGKVLVVNPNASDLCLERRWPGDSFVQALSQLLDQIDTLQVALVGSPAEREYVNGIHSRLSGYGERVRNLAGELSLGGFLGLLERTDCFLTCDTGPMHLAFALATPTVAIFGPGHPLHYVTHAEAAKTVILYEPILCSPCLYHSDFPPCLGDNQCMKLIEPESVIESCLAFLLPQEVTRSTPLPQSWASPQVSPRVSSPDGAFFGRVSLRPPLF